MKKVTLVAAALAMVMIIPAVAITKSSGSKSSKRSAQATKRATEVCKQELKVVGEENFKELYGAGDERKNAANRCVRFHKREAKRHAQRAALRECIEQVQGEDNSVQGPPDKATRDAVKECMDKKRSDRGDRNGKNGPDGRTGKNGLNGRSGRAGNNGPNGKNGRDRQKGARSGRPNPLADRLKVLETCTDEKAEDADAFETKYIAIAEEMREELKKRLDERGSDDNQGQRPGRGRQGQRPGRGRQGQRPGRGRGPDISKLLKEEPRAFRACVGSQLRELMEERHGQRGQDAPDGRSDEGGRNDRGSGGPGGPGPGGPGEYGPDISPI